MFIRPLALAALMLFSPLATAQTIPEKVVETAEKLIPGSKPDSMLATPVPGLYQISFGMQVIYLFEDGQYLLSGDLVHVDTKTNLSEEARKSGRKTVIDGLDERGMVVFSPPEFTSTITVFTDTECGYCVRLHREIQQILAGGVRVRYLGFPRAGLGSSAHKTLVSVWCSDDPLQAMTDAKQGKAVEPRICETEIEKHMQAARAVGVRGTPTIVLQDGKVIPGYVPAGDLVPMANAAVSN